MALSSLAAADDRPAKASGPAKSVIYLHMAGSPSQLELFEHKPELKKFHNKECPKEYLEGKRFAFIRGVPKMLAGQFSFKQHGESGQWISELLPEFASVADEACIIRTVNTDQFNHSPAQLLLHTGQPRLGNPSMGSWVTWGLGSENENLPGFVVLASGGKTPSAGKSLWGSGFLPSKHAGVSLRRDGDPVLFLSNPDGVSPDVRRRMLDSLAKLNQQTLDRVGDPETQSRIAQYEMAFRMQTSVPELMDVSSETKETLDMYGPDATKPGTYAYSALQARRMVERDVRFVQIFHRGWDQHGNVGGDLPKQAKDIDQASWALIQDLKQRDMLKDTLVIWGGEFGRTVYCQGNLTRENYGRDHHPRCFSIWMAGGGIKPGVVYGETDDFSYNIVENPVHIHDMNATILQCLGIDHKRLSVKFQGLDVRLTGVEDNGPVQGILA